MLKPGFSFDALIKLAEDVAADFPKIESAITTIQTVAAEVGKGQMPSPQQIATLEGDVAVVAQLVTDIKAVIA